jgi:hypothetical protein
MLRPPTTLTWLSTVNDLLCMRRFTRVKSLRKLITRAMARVVLPLAAAADVGAIELLVDVDRAVHVDVDVAPPPIAAAEDRARGGETDAPRKAAGEVAARVPDRGVSGFLCAEAG